MIAVINYNMGNLGSIMNMLRRLRVPAVLTSDPEVIRQAPALILPGVGAFDEGMSNLENLGLVDVLNEVVIEQKRPILGLCLGLQLFGIRSEEGEKAGLGWIDMVAQRFQSPANGFDIRVPHMGWNVLRTCYPHFTLSDIAEDSRYYFVHGFYVKPNNPADVLATTRYGIEFASGVAHENMVGFQFHPEKSLRWGMALISGFANHVL